MLRETARGVEEISRNATPFLSDTPAEAAPPPSKPVRPPPQSRPSSPAGPAERTATLGELSEWAREAGLSERTHDVVAKARFSHRATPARGDVESSGTYYGGIPDLDGEDWPEAAGQRLEFIAQFELGRAASTTEDLAGVIRLFAPPREGGFCTVVHAPMPAAPSNPGSARRYELTTELVIPRAFSSVLTGLDLTSDEQDAWETLRLRLAREQGVIPFDQKPGRLNLDRVLGYPDERTGDMPLRCEMTAQGAADIGRSTRAHPGAAVHEAGAEHWRLLLQINRSHATRLFMRGAERLYIWITDEALRQRDFSGVQSIWR